MRDRKPPTELDRLRLFVDLAEHYFAACDELSLPPEIKVSFTEKRVPLALEIRLMLLRKFFEVEKGKDGNVHLRRVALAFSECFKGDAPLIQENIALFAEDFNALFEGRSSMMVNGQRDANADVLYDALYGGLMHADWGRWQTHKQRVGFVETLTLTSMWKVLDHLVREAHLSVTTAFEAGHLREPKPSPEKAL